VPAARVHSSGGATVTEQARIVVGADGLFSVVARAVQAPTYHEKPARTCTYFTYWSEISVDGFEVYVRPGRVVFVFPTNDGRVSINVGWPHREFHAIRADIEGNYMRSLDLAPELAARVRNGKREERFAGTAAMPNFFRVPYDPGWGDVTDIAATSKRVTATATDNPEGGTGMSAGVARTTGQDAGGGR